MKYLLQELHDLEKYKNCLEINLYKTYKNYLQEKLLKEITARDLADAFDSVIFEKPEINSIDATINVMQKVLKATQQTKYEKKYSKIVANSRTHLEQAPGKFCNKETFSKEFAKEKFENRDDLSAQDFANILLDKYLEIYDDNGWLISKVDDYEKVKNIKT